MRTIWGNTIGGAKEGLGGCVRKPTDGGMLGGKDLKIKRKMMTLGKTRNEGVWRQKEPKGEKKQSLILAH